MSSAGLAAASSRAPSALVLSMRRSVVMRPVSASGLASRRRARGSLPDNLTAFRGAQGAAASTKTTFRQARPAGAGTNSKGTPRVRPPGSERMTSSTRWAPAATGVTKMRALPRAASTTRSPANFSASGVNPRPAQSSTGHGKSISIVFSGSVGSVTGWRSPASSGKAGSARS